MRHEAFLRNHPVFTVEDLARHLSGGREQGERAVEALTASWLKSKRIVRVRRGLFATIPPGSEPASYPVDPFLVASKLVPDAVLSHHTALEFHGRAHSVLEEFTYLSLSPLQKITFRGHSFRGTRFPKALVCAGKEGYEVVTSERRGQDLRVTSLERTLVDVLDRPDLAGGWEEIWRSLESVEYFNIDRVVEYARLLENATVNAKLGFFLDQHRDALMVEEQHLAALRVHLPKQPHYMDRTRRKLGRWVAEWNLMVPRDVLHRTWGEGR